MRPLLGRLLLAAVSLALTLAGLEAAFRVLDLRGHHAPRSRHWHDALLPDAERIPGVWPQFRPNAEFSLRYDSNPRGYFDANDAIVYHTNRYGLRGPDFPEHKPPGAFRIAVLGDSFTFGEGVWPEDLFTTRLQEILRREASPGVEVLDCGTSAWGTREEILFLEHRVLAFEPDLVLLVFVSNDAEYAGGLDLWNDFRARYEPPPWLRRSYFLGWVWARVGRALLGRRYLEEMVAAALAEQDKWAEVYALLPRGRDLSAGVGARFALVLFPFMFDLSEHHPLLPIHERMRTRAAEAGIPVLDLLDAFRGRPYQELQVHPSDQHPNEVAHAIAARAIADFLLSQGLVPEGARAPRAPPADARRSR